MDWSPQRGAVDADRAAAGQPQADYGRTVMTVRRIR